MLLCGQHRASKAACVSCAHAEKPVEATTKLPCIIWAELLGRDRLVELGLDFHGCGSLWLESDDPYVDRCAKVMPIGCRYEALGTLRWGT